jgi:hypothetical protein
MRCFLCRGVVDEGRQLRVLYTHSPSKGLFRGVPVFFCGSWFCLRKVKLSCLHNKFNRMWLMPHGDYLDHMHVDTDLGRRVHPVYARALRRGVVKHRRAHSM